MKILSILFALALAGCAATGQTPTNPQTLKLQYTQACAAYSAAFTTALQLRVAGKLSSNQIQQVNLLDQTVTPLCLGPMPSDLNMAVGKITGAVTTLGVLEVVQSQQGSKK